MSQPLIPTTILFGIGLTAGELAQYFPISLFLASVLFLLSVLYLETQRRVSSLTGNVSVGAFLIGVCLSVFMSHLTHTSTLSTLDESTPISIIGKIQGPIRNGPDRSVILLDVMKVSSHGRWEQADGLLRLTVRNLSPDINRGDVIRVHTKIRQPHGLQNPSGFDYGTLLRRQGIAATAWADGEQHIEKLASVGNPLENQTARWRTKIHTAAVHSLDGSSLAVFLAMIIGEQEYLTNEMRDDFMASGTTHILSISGAHLALVATVVFGVIQFIIRYLPETWLLRLTVYTTPTKLAAIATIPPILFYSALAGGKIPTTRALIMILVFLFAVLIERLHDGPRALALAAVLILLWDPRAIFDISFQLSFLAVFTILLVVRWKWAQRLQTHTASGAPMTGWVDASKTAVLRLLAAAAVLAAISASITISTLPLVSHAFHQVPWAGIFGNLLIVPFAGFVIIPLGLLSALWVLIADQTTLPLTDLIDSSIRTLYWLAKMFRTIPYSEYHVASPSVASIGVFYAALSLAIWSPPGRSRWWIRHSALLCASAVLVIWMWSPYTGPPEGELRVSFLDVGQGDAIVAEIPDRKIILVDGGAAYARLDMGRAVIAPYLWDLGITHIDLVVATHPEFDHMGGLPYVMSHFSVDHVWTNGRTRDAPFYHRYKAALTDPTRAPPLRESRVSRLDETIPVGSCHIEILNPGMTYYSRNDHSVVFRLRCGTHSFLMTGDIEKAAMRDMLNAGLSPEARVLKVPHHGARGSVHERFLQAVNPEIAVVSAGRYNRYGHPSASMLRMYEHLGIPVYRTDHDGAIVVKSQGHELMVVRTADRRLRPVEFGGEMLRQEIENIKRWAGSISVM